MSSLRRFAGGIVDAEGTRAALRDRQGRLVAVALDAGTLLWRSAEAMAPLLLPPGEVIACTLGAQPACVALAWSGSRAGEPVWTSQPIGLPTPPDPDLRLAAEAGTDGDTITVRWRGAVRWRGGAAPGPAQRAASRQRADGAVVVDRRSGHVQVMAPSRSAAPDDLAADELAAPGAAPDALATIDVGPRRFELCLQEMPDGRMRSVLRARAPGGATLWALPIDEALRTRARPPRP